MRTISKAPTCFRFAISAVLLLAAVSALAAEPASGQDPDSRARTAVRLSAQANGLIAGIGLEVSRHLFSRFDADVTLSYQAFGHGHEGIGGETLARVFLGGIHNVSLGVGPSLRWAPEFGPIAFGTSELAYEFRPVGNVSVLVGGGVDVALNDSGTATCPEEGWFACFLWTDHYSAGVVLPRFRIALGVSF